LTTLNELHNKLEEHLSQQSKNWDSFIYAQEKGFYQGFDAIQIDGCRSTEKRFEQYNIQKYLSENKSALDIGSNCGFFSLYVSKFLESITGIEINPYLTSIASDTQEFLEIDNANFVSSKFEKFSTDKKFDIIFSFANDSTIDSNTDFNFEEYITKIIHLLSDNGLLIFESQAIDIMIPQKFEPKMEIIKQFFTILENRNVKSEYPLNVPERLFLILKKK
jgi:predicted TPR repeat methyltransferase